jgi:hypothetical protein
MVEEDSRIVGGFDQAPAGIVVVGIGTVTGGGFLAALPLLFVVAAAAADIVFVLLNFEK